MPFFLILAAVFFILVFFLAGDNVAIYYVLMFLCGFFLGGPFNIISSAIAADLVKKKYNSLKYTIYNREKILKLKAIKKHYQQFLE